jgi:hypothetical protein
MEEIALAYGYPMDNWDVSEITEISFLFVELRTFNECIGSWNVSNVTDMSRMFYKATSVNHEIGSYESVSSAHQLLH